PEVALSTLLLTVALCSLASSAPRVHVPVTCCTNYLHRPLPQKLVKSYFQNRSQCPKPGIIFITVKGRKVCANPSETWVQKIQARIRDLEWNRKTHQKGREVVGVGIQAKILSSVKPTGHLHFRPPLTQPTLISFK
uniref:C-C motif chemokine n=1 Tax=Ornithorhynchus anatinus TaxID=9258 RepID=F7B2B3_ORNAN